MIEILLGIGIGVFTLYAAFTIVSLISIRRTSDSIRDFLMETQGNVKGALEGFNATVENMRKISSDISEVTEDVKQISHTIVEAENVLRNRLASLDQGLSSTVDANVAGLKAGVAAGVGSLLRSAGSRKE